MLIVGGGFGSHSAIEVLLKEPRSRSLVVVRAKFKVSVDGKMV